MKRRKTLLSPSPAALSCPTYRPPRHGAPVDLRLDGNEGQPVPRTILERLSRIDGEAIRRYPSAAETEAKIAKMHGIDASRVIVTAGADDAIERAVRAVLCAGREAVIPFPTFEMLSRYCARVGCDVVGVPWLDRAFPADEVLSKINEKTALVAIVSPNNPTGFVATSDDLIRIAAAAPSALLLVDLAYGEFADEDLTRVALDIPNALVVRTFSKAWGMAGLRVGWAAGPEEVIGWMRSVGQPYAVSSISLSLASERLAADDADVRTYTDRVKLERRKLDEFLSSYGVKCFPSQGNFILAEFANSGWIRDALAGQGIAVRSFDGDKNLDGKLRITLPGDEADFSRLLRAFENAHAPEAILFDMDDTLADVTDSYRRATVATAETYGVNISFDDITEAKAGGDANNDWELTWRLIKGRGVAADLGEVTRRFERFYQGDGDVPGFRSTERLMLDRAMLARIASFCSLGIVTGRPRSDAMRFLSENGIEDLFGTVVTMDDGPLKPDPAPVRTAIQKLCAVRAWMIGDTPDDIRSARAAGALPIGVLAPADDPSIARSALIRAGAARVLGDIAEIMEVLP